MNVNGTRTSIGGTALRSPMLHMVEVNISCQVKVSLMILWITSLMTALDIQCPTQWFSGIRLSWNTAHYSLVLKTFVAAEFAGAMFINLNVIVLVLLMVMVLVKAACCSICWQSFGNIACWLTKKHLSVINHYAPPFYADPSTTCIVVTSGEFSIRCCDGSAVVPCLKPSFRIYVWHFFNTWHPPMCVVLV